MATYESISFGVSDGIAKLVLNRPEVLNSLTMRMVDEIGDAVEHVARDKDIRVLLITGAGRAFTSGADLSTSGDMVPGVSDAGESLELCFNPLVEKMVRLPKPIVTAVNGPAAGAGCSLSLLGDVVIAAESAYFLQAFVNIGLVPDVCSTWLLPRLIGRARASAMMMLGERIPAQTAQDWGLIYKAVPDAELDKEAMAIATRFAQGPTRSYGLIRNGIRMALEASLTDTLALERANQFVAGCSEDFVEGVAAFTEKRKARFVGA